MEIAKLAHIYHTNSTHYFQNNLIAGYKPPKTYLERHDIKESSLESPHPVPNKQNLPHRASTHSFTTAKRDSLLIVPNSNPSPFTYSILQNNNVKNVNRPSPCFQKSSRFNTISKEKECLNKREQNEESECKKKSVTMKVAVIKGGSIDKSVRQSYYDTAVYMSAFAPCVGQYNLTLPPKKSFQKVKTYTSLQNLRKKTREKEQRKEDKTKKFVGPQSYNLPRSESASCSIKYFPERGQDKKQQKEQNNGIKRRKSNLDKRQFLKIDQWCMYSKGKKILKGLNTCSRPNTYLKIYR